MLKMPKRFGISQAYRADAESEVKRKGKENEERNKVTVKQEV